MLAGMIIFNRGQSVFKESGLAPAESLEKKYFGLNKIALVWIAAFSTVPIFVLLLNQNKLMSYILAIVVDIG